MLSIHPCFLLAPLLLSACAAVAPPSQLAVVQARHDSQLPAAANGALGAAVSPSADWWLSLQDPQLIALVQQAVSRNLELKATLATVQEARAMAGLASREALPQGSLGMSAQRQRLSMPEVNPYGLDQARPPEQNLISLNQGLSWELDLFGRIATAQAVAERELDMALADQQAAQALLQAEVVKRYVQLRASQQQLGLNAQQLSLAELRRAQLQARHQAGLADAREWRGAEAEVALRQAERAALQAQTQHGLAVLALLCGQAPSTLNTELAHLREPRALPSLPLQQALPTPEGLLQRLPQVARADAALRASMGQQVLAERAHLPRLSLAASVGLLESPARLNKAEAVRYVAGPVLQWDWLDAGRLKAREQAALAGKERMWLQFEHTVLQALAEAETSLRGWSGLLQAWQDAQSAERAAAEASRYAQARQRAGLEPPLQALNAQAQLLEAQQRSLGQQAQALQAFVQVQLALGSWQAR